jgi:hypothetical protein
MEQLEVSSTEKHSIDLLLNRRTVVADLRQYLARIAGVLDSSSVCLYDEGDSVRMSVEEDVLKDESQIRAELQLARAAKQERELKREQAKQLIRENWAYLTNEDKLRFFTHK